MQRQKRIPSNRIRVQYRLEDELAEWVRAEAQRMGVPYSSIICWAVAAYRNQQTRSPGADCQPEIVGS